MTAEVKERTIQIALEASGAVGTCEFVVVPHPLERDSIADDLLAREQVAGVAAHVERRQSLYEVLNGAWALVTGWSNSVFEGLLGHVPAICITATRSEPPTTFVEDGLALGATSHAGGIGSPHPPRSTPSSEPDSSIRPGQALAEHVGPLDGRAAERSAALITELAGLGPSGPRG